MTDGVVPIIYSAPPFIIPILYDGWGGHSYNIGMTDGVVHSYIIGMTDWVVFHIISE